MYKYYSTAGERLSLREILDAINKGNEKIISVLQFKNYLYVITQEPSAWTSIKASGFGQYDHVHIDGGVE